MSNNTDQRVAEAGAPNTETDKSAKSARLGFATIMVVAYSAIVAVVTFIAWGLFYFLPLLIVIGGLVLSDIWRHEWLDARSQFGQPDSPQVNKFINNINRYEDSTNMAVFVFAFMVSIWNYIVMLMWFVVQMVFNFMLWAFKYILTPYLQSYVVPVLTAGMQITSTVATELSLQSSSSTSSATAYSSGGGGVANYTQIGNFTTTEIATRAFQTIMSFEPFFVAMNASQYGEIVNWLADPLLKNAPELFKFAADSAALTSIGGAWTRVLAEDAIGKQASALLTSSDCFSARATRASLCATQSWLAESLNKVAHLDGMSIASPTCDIPEIACSVPSGIYSGESRTTPWDASTGFLQSLLGPGQCSALECEYFVEDAYTAFALQPNATCAYWVDDPASVYNCMLRVQAFVDVNNTARSQASPSTLGAEMCLVARAQNLASCRATGLPFQWDPAPQAAAVCNSPQLNTTFETCSCTNRAPLCNQSCCESYAAHVQEQVILQIGALTCAEIATYFPAVGIFCPLIAPETINLTSSTARFPDNTYQSMFCQYAQTVIAPLCTTAPSFTRLRDLDTWSAVPAFTTIACNNTVAQKGVCLPINATVDSLALDIINYPLTEPVEGVLDYNDATTYTLGTYLVTDFALGDSAQSIIGKGLQKHFCEQFSQIYKNDNMLYQSQPWTPLALSTEYCDGAVYTAAGDISIGSSAFYKYDDGEGVPIPVVMAGLPYTASAFNELVNPNLQIGGACTGQVGPNVNEITALDQCSEALRTLVYNLAGQATVDTSEVLSVFVAQDNYTSEFYTATGLVPIDPADPNYAQKEIELVRTNNVLSYGLDFQIIPWQDLIDATPPFRTEFDVAPPDSSPYNHLPAYPVYTGADNTNEGTPSSISIGRVILSVPSGTANTDNTAPHPERWVDKVVAYMTGGVKPKDKWDRAYEGMFRRRLRETGRRLQGLVTPAAQDVKMASIDKGMLANAHMPTNMTTYEFNAFLVADSARLMVMFADFFRTLFLPKVLHEIAMLMMVATEGFNATKMLEINQLRMTEAAAATSSSGGATVFHPFTECGEFTDSYTCCKPLLGCIDFNPNTFYQERTDESNLERWNCDECDYFIGWQYWFWKAFISVVTSLILKRVSPSQSYDTFPGTLVIPYNELPTNFANCMFVNMYFGFLLATILVGVFYIITIGIIGLLAIMFSNARQQQESEEFTENQIFDIREQMIQQQSGASHTNLIHGSTSAAIHRQPVYRNQ
jgi:hypothetical protein